MERIEAINTNRIAWCCADHGITPEQLAVECDISLASMQSVMEGNKKLTFNQLRSIAEYFGRGVLFFLEVEPIAPEQVHSTQFRTLANKKPELSPRLRALIERVEKHRDFYLALREDLDEGDSPRFDAPDVSGKSPAQAAVIARKWLGLQAENSFDSYRRALESRGVLVFRSNGYNGKWQIAKENPILGFSLYDQHCPVIVVKKLAWEPRQSFTLMHELGHLLLNKMSSIDDEGDLFSHEGAEKLANAFAGHLLVPEDFLNSIIDANRPQEVSQFDVWLERQRRAWGVSGEVILRRLRDVGRLPEHLYSAYRNWRNMDVPIEEEEGGNRAYRHREPRHIFGDIYVRTVLTSLSARNITLSKASSYLDSLQIKDLHRLEQFYADL